LLQQPFKEYWLYIELFSADEIASDEEEVTKCYVFEAESKAMKSNWGTRSM